MFYRHPHWLPFLIALAVLILAYAAWWIFPVAVAVLFPVAVTAVLLLLSGKLPQTLLDWIFVVVVVTPLVTLALGILEELQPIVPLILAVGTTLFVRNKLLPKKSHGVHHGDNNNRRV